MIPVLTPEEMSGVDRGAPEPSEVLVGRAGFAVAAAARRTLSGAYGRRVVVVAGPGSNGADGRAAASHLSRWGASVLVLPAGDLAPGSELPEADLVLDAAYGTGLSRPYSPPDARGAQVLAVDIPSGLSGLTGRGDAMTAVRTVTFGAFKPGALVGFGPDRCGEVELAGIGLEAAARQVASTWVVEDSDVAAMLPGRPRTAHKWQTAVAVAGGSPGMPGAALMVARGALRAGAGYALVGVPGSSPGGGLPAGEHVVRSLPEASWDEEAAAMATRARALVVGPGLGALARGPGQGAASAVGRLLAGTSLPAVVDADAIAALGDLDAVRQVAAARRGPMVLTPHEGEYARLTGHPPGEDRIGDLRATAAAAGSVVLLKGSPTLVADPGGSVRVVTAGSARLASAGTGDVLSGVLAAFLARGLGGADAAALAAHCHGRAAARGPAEGLIASDLPELVSAWLSGASA